MCNTKNVIPFLLVLVFLPKNCGTFVALDDRDAPEGADAWAMYEKIADEAMASVGGMETVEYLPP